jgi:hypothetical protein
MVSFQGVGISTADASAQKIAAKPRKEITDYDE